MTPRYGDRVLCSIPPPVRGFRALSRTPAPPHLLEAFSSRWLPSGVPAPQSLRAAPAAEWGPRPRDEEREPGCARKGSGGGGCPRGRRVPADPGRTTRRSCQHCPRTVSVSRLPPRDAQSVTPRGASGTHDRKSLARIQSDYRKPSPFLAGMK